MGNDEEDAGGATGGFLGDAWESVAGAGQAIGGAIEFAQDPVGFMFQKAQEASYGLAHTVMPALFEATKPDLTLDWFQQAYAVAFALGVFLWVTLLLVTIVRAAQGALTSNEVADVLTIRAAQFFGGATFGPAVGWFVLQFFGVLTESITAWAIGGSTAEALDGLATMIEDTDAGGVVGGVLVALLLMIFMLLGLLLVLVTLVVTLVAVYVGGAVAPLALAWLAHPQHARIAMRLLLVLLGIVASKPVLFFVLGVAYRMTSSSVTWLDDGNTELATVANLLAAACAICIAGLMPFLLFKFAPVLPTGAGQSGASVNASSSQSSDSDDDGGSRTSRRSQERASERGQEEAAGADDGGGGGGPGGGGGTGSAGGGAEPGPIESAVQARQKSAATGQEAGAGGAGEAGAGVKPGAEPAPGAGGAGAPKPVPAGAGAGAGSAGGAGGPGAGSAGASGAAASSSSGAAAGAGAAGAAGVAGGVAGGVAVAAVIAAQKAAERGAQGGQLAASEMDEGEGS